MAGEDTRRMVREVLACMIARQAPTTSMLSLFCTDRANGSKAGHNPRLLPTRQRCRVFFGGVDLDCPKLLTICLPEDQKAKSPTL